MKTLAFRDALPKEAHTLALLNARAYALRDGKPIPVEVGEADVADL